MTNAGSENPLTRRTYILDLRRQRGWHSFRPQFDFRTSLFLQKHIYIYIYIEREREREREREQGPEQEHI
jgi:hypothetical protein